MKILVTLLVLLPVLLFAQPVIDGVLSDANYITVATKQNSNSGFGGSIDVSKIVYYPDVTNSILYLGVVGKLNIANNDEIGIWLNVTGTGSPTGVAAGNKLGVDGFSGFIGAGNNNYKADFEVDYQFAFNPGSNISNVYFDAAKMVGTPAGHYQGTTNQTGTSATNDNENGTVFSLNSLTWAFNNGGGANQGLELKIPFSEIGATSAMDISVFAFVVSNSGYFSNVSVPGDISGNPGNNPNFNSNLREDNSTSIGTGSYHSTPVSPLPVELTSFYASIKNKSVNLVWHTATEVNNYGFEVEKTSPRPSPYQGEGGEAGRGWVKVGFVKGSGNSNSANEYSYTDKTVATGKYIYRLKQIDNDGKYEYSKEVEVDLGKPTTFALNQNYPNPFNPTTSIEYSVVGSQYVSLKVFNVLGKEVAVLVNEKQEPGVYTVNFSSANLSGGVYLYRLQAGDFVQTKKMILLK